MGGYIYGLPKFWEINSNFAEFLQDLHQYKNKVHELDRIQFSEGANLQTIFPVLWEEVLQHHPSIHLRFYAYSNFDVDWIASFTDLENLSIEVGGNNSIIRNLEKLAEFQSLKSLVLSADNGFGNLNFLNGVNPKLQELYLCSKTKSAKSDLSVLTSFQHLETLSLVNLEKNLDKAVSSLSALETLTLRSISKPQHINFINGLKNLQFLTLQLCSFENIDAAAQLPKLKYLQLWRLPKLKNLDFVSQMQGLQFLFVETLNGITRFPKVADLKHLRRVKIASCKNLTDFSEVAYSHSIREFAVQNATQPNLDIYIPIIENQHIENLGIGHEKAAIQKEMQALAQKHGREQITVCMYPDFEQFVFE